MRRDLLTSLLAVIVMTVFLGIVYPLAITGISQVVFPGKANGSKVSANGRVVGSSLLGQSFSHPVIGKNGKPALDEEGEEVLAPDKAYFQPRPSATPGPTASKRAKKCANTSPPMSPWRSRMTTA
jgi:K+-transporting ATPase ATPase C chain